jgi:hypothetical protein
MSSDVRLASSGQMRGSTSTTSCRLTRRDGVAVPNPASRTVAHVAGALAVRPGLPRAGRMVVTAAVIARRGMGPRRRSQRRARDVCMILQARETSHVGADDARVSR